MKRKKGKNKRKLDRDTGYLNKYFVKDVQIDYFMYKDLMHENSCHFTSST